MEAIGTPAFTPFWDSLIAGFGRHFDAHAWSSISTPTPNHSLRLFCFITPASTLKMLLQKPVLTRRPSGPTVVIVTSSLLFILFLLTASHSGVRAKASAYFPGNDSSDILQDVFNRTLGVSVLANTSVRDCSGLTID